MKCGFLGHLIWVFATAVKVGDIWRRSGDLRKWRMRGAHEAKECIETAG